MDCTPPWADDLVDYSVGLARAAAQQHHGLGGFNDRVPEAGSLGSRCWQCWLLLNTPGLVNGRLCPDAFLRGHETDWIEAQSNELFTDLSPSFSTVTFRGSWH